MRYHKRYVNRRERLEMEAASQQFLELAIATSLTKQATPALRKSPFLAYHAECWRRDCELARRDASMHYMRVLVAARALLALTVPRP